MIELIVAILLLSLVLGGLIGWVIVTHKKMMREFSSLASPEIPAPVVQVDLSPLKKDMQAVPGKVLASIQNATNTEKGKVAEYIGYLQLNAEYDRIVPLGNIVDFMGIKFPDGDVPGYVDFIDIKTGKSARLSKDQRALQKLIENKLIGFKKVQISTSDCVTRPAKPGE